MLYREFFNSLTSFLWCLTRMTTNMAAACPHVDGPCAAGFPNPSPSWYAVQVRPRCEHKIASMLEYKGIEQFVPARVTTKEFRPGARNAQVLFAGYVFCRVDLSQRSVPVVTTPGVIRFIGTGNTPIPIPDEEMEAIRRITRLSSALGHSGRLPVGRKIRVIDGPLKGIEGRVCEFRNRSRLVVQLNLIHQSISVEIDEASVASLDE
jgi:transcription antitermination factor NusG